MVRTLTSRISVLCSLSLVSLFSLKCFTAIILFFWISKTKINFLPFNFVLFLSELNQFRVGWTGAENLGMLPKQKFTFKEIRLRDYFRSSCIFNSAHIQEWQCRGHHISPLGMISASELGKVSWTDFLWTWFLFLGKTFCKHDGIVKTGYFTLMTSV